MTTARRGPPHEVRIIGGAWKRSKLPVPDGPGLRPTPDRVRVTLFNWLGPDLSGWRCLDAFAGSGALGFEAASRGAAEVVLLETDRAALAALRATRERLGAATVKVETGDAIGWMGRAAPARFELVFLDAPFGSALGPSALAAAPRLMVAGGLLYFEAAQPLTAEQVTASGLRLHREGRAGAVCFHLLQAP